MAEATEGWRVCYWGSYSGGALLRSNPRLPSVIPPGSSWGTTKIDHQRASKPTHFLRTSMTYFNKSLNSLRFFICRIKFAGINDTSDSITSSTSSCAIVMGSG